MLSTHPDVEDVAVIRVPNARWGEVGNAVVVAASGAAPSLQDLHEHAADRLARFKLPKHLVLVDDLPRNVTGKVSREELKPRYGGR